MNIISDLFSQTPQATVSAGWVDLLTISIAFLIALLVRRFSWYLAAPFVSVGRVGSRSRQVSEERLTTLRGLFASIIGFTGFTVAFFFALSRFIDVDTLIWVAGLFSAAFGLGARPQVSDFLSGIGFLFEDTFDVGEKVEIKAGQDIEGVIEAVHLRTTMIRSPEGELYTVPNGEIRVVRNFSRGIFSVVRITLKVASENLERTIETLEGAAEEAVIFLPNLIEEWQLYSSTGAIGANTELTVVGKARFGRAAEMRPRMLSFVQKRLADEGIELVN